MKRIVVLFLSIGLLAIVAGCTTVDDWGHHGGSGSGSGCDAGDHHYAGVEHSEREGA